MTGLARADRLGPRWRQFAVLALAGGIGVTAALLPLDLWVKITVAVATGWMVASVAYVWGLVFSGRLIGFSAAVAVLLLALPTWWKLFVLLAVAMIAALVIVRVQGLRNVDVASIDRSALPYRADDGNRLVDALDGLWGSTRPGGTRCGLRAAHSHGSLAEGTWKARYEDGDRKIGVALFASGRHGRAVVRFSNFDGWPARDDRSRTPHGMSVRLESHDAGTLDLVLVDIERFPVATREDFVTLTEYFQYGKLGKYRRLAWLAVTGRSSFPALVGLIGSRATSYATRTYHGLNTFYWELEPGQRPVPVRYVARPVDPAEVAPPVAQSVRAALDEDLRRRLAGDRIIRFQIDLELGRTLGGHDLSKDRVDDCLRKWPGRLQRRPLCEITLKEYCGDDDRRHSFDPLQLPAGIEPSDDEILLARGASYSTSYLRRRPAGSRST